MNVSHMTLKILAAITWYIGVLILLTKGAELAQDAHDLEPEGMGKRLAWIIGIVVGVNQNPIHIHKKLPEKFS